MRRTPADSDERPATSERPVLPAGFEAGGKGQLRRMLAEGLGTFALTAVDAGGAMVASLDSGVSFAARSAASGLLVASMSYALSNVSGAHFNPAVTLGFALRRVFPWRFVPGYWLAQVVGAVLAAIVLRQILGPIALLGTTEPSVGPGAAVAMETLLTFLLVTVILSTATRFKVLAPIAPLASGATVALCGLFSRPITGASMNPARSLGPALVSLHFEGYWVYVVGPTCGAFLAFLTVSLVHPRHHQEEREAAEGR
jgi:MIP family channel proteins